MRLALFAMPIHPIGKDWRKSLAEDREIFILADRLGFSEGFVGEHTTDPEETITSPAVFIATLAEATRQIKLGTGGINLPNHHPVETASTIAMLDHLLDGRFVFGISPGSLATDAEAYGNFGLNRPEMFLEAINQIISIWTTDPPYDIRGQYWNISTIKNYIPEIGMGRLPKPYQRPHPPIAVTVVAPSSKGIAEAAARGWSAISAHFVIPKWLKTHWSQYCEGCARASLAPDLRQWRVSRAVYVDQTDQAAEDYAMNPNGPYYYLFNSLYTKLRRRGALGVFKEDPDIPDAEVTIESVCDQLIIRGSPQKVAEDIMALRDKIGEFGTLVYVQTDWQHPHLARRSMTLMAEKVLPRIRSSTQAIPSI